MKFKIQQNLWDATETQLKGKYLALNVYIRKYEKSQYCNPRFYIIKKKIEKEE